MKKQFQRTLCLMSLMLVFAGCLGTGNHCQSLLLEEVKPGWTPEYFSYLAKKEILEKIQNYARTKPRETNLVFEQLSDFSCEPVSAVFPAKFRVGAVILVHHDGAWNFAKVTREIKASEITEKYIEVRLSKGSKAVAVRFDAVRISLKHRFPY